MLARFLKRLLKTLLLMASLIVMAAVLVLVSFDDDDYRRWLIRLVNQQSDGKLKISGKFTLDIGLNPAIRAGNVTFQAANGNGSVIIGQLEGQIELLRLFNRSIWFNRLVLNEAEFNLPLSDENSTSQDPIAWLPVIEQAELNNVTFRHHRSASALPMVLQIRQFRVTADSRSQRLMLAANGSFESRDFILQGEAGRLDQLLQPTEPYPFKLTFNHPNAELLIDGTIKRPADGEGLDLRIHYRANELSQLLRTFRVDLPDLGQLNIDARLSGDLRAPKVDDLKITVDHDTDVVLSIAGTINNLLTGQGTMLDINGSVNNPAVLAWAMPEGLPPFNQLQLSGRLSRSETMWMIESFKAKLATAEELHLTLQGKSGIVADFDSQMPFRAVDLALQLSSPTTAAVKPMIAEDFPEMGALKGQARLTSLNNLFSLKAVNLLFDSGAVQIGLKGEIAKMPLAADRPNSGQRFTVSLKADHTAAVAKIFKLDLPELGAIELNADWQGGRHHSTITPLKLRTTIADQQTVEVGGEISLGDLNQPDPIQHFAGTIHISAHSTAELGRSFKQNWPKLGAIEAQATFTGNGHVAQLDQIKVKAGVNSSVELNLSGKVASIPLTRGGTTATRLAAVSKPVTGIELVGRVNADDAKQLSETLDGPEIGPMGPLEARFALSGTSHALILSDVQFEAGRTDGLSIRAEGGIDAIYTASSSKPGWLHGVHFTFNAQAPTLNEALAPASPYIDGAIPVVGPFRLTADIIDRQGQLTVDPIQIQLGPVDQPLLQAEGVVKDRSTNRPRFEALFTVPTAEIIALYGQRRNLPDLGLMKINATIAETSQEGLTFDRFNLSAERSGLYAFQLEQVSAAPQQRLNVALSLDDFSLINQLFETEVPYSGRFQLSGQLMLAADKKQPDRFQGTVRLKKSELTGEVQVARRGGHQRYAVEIATPALYLSDFKGESGQSEAVQPVPFFSSEPQPLLANALMDINVLVKTGSVIDEKIRSGPITFDLTLNKGQSIRAVPSAGEELVVKARIDGGAQPRFSLKLLGRHSRLDDQRAGNLYLNADLNGTGHSFHEIASTLKGHLGMVLENSEIGSAGLDLISLDLLSWLFDLITDKQEAINCAAVHFKLQHGVAKSTLLLLDTPTLLATGQATLNLAKETINMQVRTEPKKTVLPNDLMVTIDGPFQSPQVDRIALTESVIKSYSELLIEPFKLTRHISRYIGSMVGLAGDARNKPCLKFQ